MMTQDPSGTATTGTAGNSPVADEGGLPANWIEAIPALVASRIGIFQIEAKDALEATVRKLIISGVLAFCLIAAWMLLTAGLTGLISSYFNIAWYFAAFSLGGIHLLIAIFIRLVVKRSSNMESFPITREEFEKDRQWLNQLKNRSSSPD
jgi:uncharacterized membrane protein YqjE